MNKRENTKSSDTRLTQTLLTCSPRPAEWVTSCEVDAALARQADKVTLHLQAQRLHTTRAGSRVYLVGASWLICHPDEPPYIVDHNGEITRIEPK